MTVTMNEELDRRRRYRYAQMLETNKDQRKNPVKQALFCISSV